MQPKLEEPLPLPCIEAAALLAGGASVEPLIHPKPGGVTRCAGTSQHTVYEFTRSYHALHSALLAACMHGCKEGCLHRALTTYRALSTMLGVHTNTLLGTLTLLTPLACTFWGRRGNPEMHATEASKCALNILGYSDAKAYYDLLHELHPSHLGVEFSGKLPPIGSQEVPRSFGEIVRSVEDDIIHLEIANGYPITLTALKWIANNGVREDSLGILILRLISEYGDTLIGRKWGFNAMKLAKREARIALLLIEKGWDWREVVNKLRAEWSRRGWNPGAILDVVATALGLYYLHYGFS